MLLAYDLGPNTKLLPLFLLFIVKLKPWRLLVMMMLVVLVVIVLVIH